MAKRHFAFPPIEDITSWENPLTGETHMSAEGQEGEKQKRQTKSSDAGIARRNTFLQGNEKVRKSLREDEEEAPQEAEVQVSNANVFREKMRQNAREHVGKSTHSVANEDMEADVESKLNLPRNFVFGQDSLQSDKGGVKDVFGGAKKASETVSVTLRQNAPEIKVEKRDAKDLLNASHLYAESSNRFDAQISRASTAVHNFAGFSGQTDKEVFDLVMHVLEHESRGKTDNTQLASECVDFAKALQQRVTDDAVEARKAVDLFAAIDRSQKQQEWRQDPMEQTRAGIWALHVAAKRAGLSTNNLASGFKQQALAAMGRLAMQALLNSKAEAAGQGGGKSKIALENTLTKGQTSASSGAGATKAFRIDVDAMMRQDSTLQDLQLLQNGIEMDTTADELFDAFVETLRNDELDVETAQTRKDILIGAFEAHEEETERHVKFAPTEHSRAAFANVSKPFRTDIPKSVKLKTDTTGSSHAFSNNESKHATFQTVKHRKQTNPWEQRPDVSFSIDAQQSEREQQKTETVGSF